MKRSIYIIGSFLLPFAAHAQNFKLEGRVSGLPDRTMLYLERSMPEKAVDSALVTNGRFTFTGTLNEPAERALLRTKDASNYTFLWIEKSNMTFDGADKFFKKAIITGSEMQKEAEELNRQLAVFSNSVDSVRNLMADKTLSDQRKEELRHVYSDLMMAQEKTYQTYIAKHPGSPNAATILNIYASTWGKPIVEPLYNNLTAAMKQTKMGAGIKSYLDINQDMKTGKLFADFAQADPSGKMVAVSSVKAKYKLLEFWASWCGPCRADNPELVKTYMQYKPKGFEIVGVSLDDNKQKWIEAIKADGLPWLNISDLQGDKNHAALMYGISFVPNNFLIDEKGMIVAQNLRGDQLKKKLEELLK